MENIRVECQVCCFRFERLSCLRKHVNSPKHGKRMADMYKTGSYKNRGFFPSIIMCNWPARRDKEPILGLSLMTVCFSSERRTTLYLCHVCEENCPPYKIAAHLSSIDHMRNYFNYTNPNALNFSWIPSKDRTLVLRPEVSREVKETQSGPLQVLDLPASLLKKIERSKYSEVMSIFSENAKLLNRFEVDKPKRMMIQTYQRDRNRRHPLLGMQHLVECICDGPTEKRHYLCTLCKLTLATNTIIKHVLSFDHIFYFFREWHPSTLRSKVSYQDYKSFASTILNLAKQAEEIHSTANTDIKQVSLEPAKFASVNFSCYAQALEELESIRKENKEDSLITSVKPGNRLEPRTGSAAPVVRAMPIPSMTSAPEAPPVTVAPAAPTASAMPAAPEAPGAPTVPEAPAAPAVTVAPAASAVTVAPAVSEAPAASADSEAPAASSVPVALLYKLRCQNCSMSFENIQKYCTHLMTSKHKQMVKKFFGGDYDNYQTGYKPYLGLHMYLKRSLSRNHALVGVPLVVALVTTQVQKETIYVCFACCDCFPESSLDQHFDSNKHLIHTLLYQNPWRLTFAWDQYLDVKVLRSRAWEEEKERGPKEMMLKVLDMPYLRFHRFITLSYPEVMEKLQLHHTILRHDLPPCEMRSKLQQNEKFPLLGLQFLVIAHVYDTQNQLREIGSLCLLCKRRLLCYECHAHVFSREHVAAFLDRVHPGSQNSSTGAETLLDLAKQAARTQVLSSQQKIKVEETFTTKCSYDEALRILGFGRTLDGKGRLFFPSVKRKMKLVPRETLKEVDKDHVRETSQKNTMGWCEKTSQNSENGKTTLTKISGEAAAEVTKTHCVASGEKGDDTETPTPNEKESEKRREELTSLEEKSDAGRETCQLIKEEKTEKPTGTEPSGQTIESCQSTDRKVTQKRKISQDTCPIEGIKQETDNKKQRLTSEEDTSCKELPNQPSSTQKEVITSDKRESGKPSHETAKDKASSNTDDQQQEELWSYVKRKSREPVVGLSALLECHCDERDPIYLCKCCSLKIPEKDIVSHVTGVWHQRMYLMGLQKLPTPQAMHQEETIKHLATLFEQENGNGEAQVVEVDDEIYLKISKQNFKSAIQSVRALQDQQNSRLEIPSTPGLSGVQPDDINRHAQHEVSSVTDSYQVLDMEIEDDPEDSEAQLSSRTAAVSVMTETTFNTLQILPQSSTVSRGSEDKAEIISNTTVGTSETAANSHSAVTAPTASTMAISKFIATSSTKDISKSTAPISKPTAATPSCTTATTKFRETADNYTHTATTSISTAVTSKFTAATSTSSATISSTTSTTKSVTSCKPPESRTDGAAKVPPTSYKATTASNAGAAPDLKVENTAKNSEKASKTAVSSQPMGTSVATAKMMKSSVKYENTEASVKTAHTKHSSGSTADVAPTVHKSKASAAAHPRARPDSKSPHTEPSHTPASKTKPSDGIAIGINQLIAVTCERKRQVYCRLCSVRLRESSHTRESIHQDKYVKMRYPDWNGKESELQSKVAELAETEKKKGSRFFQSVEVKIDVYQELAELSEDEAIKRLKELLRQRDLQGSSPSSTDTAEVLRNKGPKEKRLELQTHLIQFPEIGSSSKEEETLAVSQSDRAQSVKSSEPEDDDMNKNEPSVNPSIQDAGTAVQEEKAHSVVPPPATDSAKTFAQTPDTCQETPDNKQEQEKSDPKLQNTQKALESSQKTSRVKVFKSDLPISAATVNTEQQKQPRPTQKEVLPVTLIGESIQGCSNLSTYLKVKGLEDGEPVLGMGSLWECRGMPPLNPFYLCESCMETLSIRDICSHIVNHKHLFNYMKKQYSGFLYFWYIEELAQSDKVCILKSVAEMLSPRERKMDAQGILLSSDFYKCVQTAPFSEALQMVQKIKKAQKLVLSCPPICTPQQKVYSAAMM